jgi:hypothetical protein
VGLGRAAGQRHRGRRDRQDRDQQCHALHRLDLLSAIWGCTLHGHVDER